MLTYTGFAVILFSGLAVLSLFVTRKRARENPTFKAWGYPWAPGAFCAVSFVIVLNAIVTAPGPAMAGVGVIAAGLPIYWWTRARRETRSNRNSLRAGVLQS